MNIDSFHSTRTASVAVLTLGLSALLASFAAINSGYQRENLVADTRAKAAHVDPALVNGWGLAFSPRGLAAVADAGDASISIFTPNGLVAPLHVRVPAPPTSTEAAAPTGLVFNPTEAFLMVHAGQIHPAAILVATENGSIAGFSPAFGKPEAFTVVDSTRDGASYKGLARARAPEGERLYATDFHNGRVDVFDASFEPVQRAGAFVDPTLPAHYFPFGIQAIEERVYVTYAYKLSRDDGDETPGTGLGIVSEFQTDGAFTRRFASFGALDAPWGVTLAPPHFGEFSHALLIGNFGDGRISAFDRSGNLLGQLHALNGRPIEIEGLWGLAFESGPFASTQRLYFAAGPDDESHGLFGFLQSVHD